MREELYLVMKTLTQPSRATQHVVVRPNCPMAGRQGEKKKKPKNHRIQVGKGGCALSWQLGRIQFHFLDRLLQSGSPCLVFHTTLELIISKIGQWVATQSLAPHPIPEDPS